MLVNKPMWAAIINGPRGEGILWNEESPCIGEEKPSVLRMVAAILDSDASLSAADIQLRQVILCPLAGELPDRSCAEIGDALALYKKDMDDAWARFEEYEAKKGE